jgi:pyruvate/2-oxoglutarate dehydrogenase complex dihydrolipoamide acyltransferase (E2) component
MRIAIEMANVGFDQETARISGWVRHVGDRVERGDVIAEVETEKATVELQALQAGTLVEIVHDAGAEVPIGAVIGYLDDGE